MSESASSPVDGLGPGCRHDLLLALENTTDEVASEAWDEG